jgi:hypothetical protein
MESIKIVALCAGSFLAGGTFIYFFGWWRMHIRRLAKLLYAANENVKQLEAARDLSISALAQYHETHRGQLLVLQNTKDAAIRRTVAAHMEIDTLKKQLNEVGERAVTGSTSAASLLSFSETLDECIPAVQFIKTCSLACLQDFRAISGVSTLPRPVEKDVDVSGGNNPIILTNTIASESTQVD